MAEFQRQSGSRGALNGFRVLDHELYLGGASAGQSGRVPARSDRLLQFLFLGAPKFRPEKPAPCSSFTEILPLERHLARSPHFQSFRRPSALRCRRRARR